MSLLSSHCYHQKKARAEPRGGAAGEGEVIQCHIKEGSVRWEQRCS